MAKSTETASTEKPKRTIKQYPVLSVAAKIMRILEGVSQENRDRVLKIVNDEYSAKDGGVDLTAMGI